MKLVTLPNGNKALYIGNLKIMFCKCSFDFINCKNAFYLELGIIEFKLKK